MYSLLGLGKQLRDVSHVLPSLYYKILYYIGIPSQNNPIIDPTLDSRGYKAGGTFIRPKDITRNLNAPYLVTYVVLAPSPFAIPTR